jgi:hypothetical protein
MKLDYIRHSAKSQPIGNKLRRPEHEDTIFFFVCEWIVRPFMKPPAAGRKEVFVPLAGYMDKAPLPLAEREVLYSGNRN